jgi:putative CocE/NonD family hydrolase
MNSIELKWGVTIPTHDGVLLHATLYRPKGQSHPLPTIFTMTPYTADTYHEHAVYFARHGYNFATVDCRGRGNSEGTFRPNIDDGRDGHSVVEWLARQPWADGQVAMWGASYSGYSQWVTLKESPPHLKTIVPAASVCPGINFPMVNNIHFSHAIQWLMLTSGKTTNRAIFEDARFWIEKYSELYLNHLPFRALDRVVGNLSTAFQEYLNHPTYDEFWEALNPTEWEYGLMGLPVLTITGQYDANQSGAIHYYRMHTRHGPPGAADKHFLVIGPWDHAGTLAPSSKVGGLKLGEASLVDLKSLHKEWYDWILKGAIRPSFLQRRVAFYVTGEERWRYADGLEDFSTSARTLYLDSAYGQAHDVFCSGVLNQTAPAASPPDSYVYDPLDSGPAELDRRPSADFLTTQRTPLSPLRSGLVYHSTPLDRETQLAGHVRLVVWLAMDVPDTDFHAILYEIMPDGTSVWLTADAKRARYNASLKQEEPAIPGEIKCYRFETFPFVARRLKRGSRLRLVFNSLNSIYWEKNYNSGGVVADETAAHARPARVTLYHDERRQSFLELPVSG